MPAPPLLSFLPIASCSTGFGSPIVRLSRKPHPSQMRQTRLVVRLEERKVTRRKTRKNSFALFAAISQVSACHPCAWGPCVGVRRAMALTGDAKQATSEGRSGPVEIGLTAQAAIRPCSNTALIFKACDL